MTDSELAARLPSRIPIEALRECQRRAKVDLGGDFLIFKRVVYYQDNAFIGYPGLDDDDVKSSHAAECRCTACGRKFHLGWHAETVWDYGAPCRLYGVRVPEGLDGVMYASSPTEDAEDTVLYRDGDTARCPECDADLTVKHASFFRAYGGCHSRVWRVMFGTVHNVDCYTVLVFWLVTRVVDRDANVSTNADAMYAVAVRPDKRLSYFRADSGAWKRVNPVDPCQRVCHSTDAAGTNKIGAIFCRNIPNQSGMSAEKTGLADYLEQGGHYPVLYLRFQFVHPYVENLVKAGWVYSIDSAIASHVLAARTVSQYVTFPHELQELPILWKSSQPRDMLRMSRAEVKRFAAEHWEAPILDLWLQLSAAGLFRPGEVPAFWNAVGTYGVSGLSDWAQMCHDGHAVSLDRVARYIAKQHENNDISPETGFRLFLDYRRMLRQIDAATGTPADSVELFPADLRTAHNRAAAQVTNLAATINAQKFLDLKAKWADLEFSDGAICARLPASQADLIEEGRKLHHCVSSYGNQHLSGKLIVFIRHARRPERPWFTLNVDVTGIAPREVQLHGYGNEFAHGHRLRIPQAVRDFCDTWEKDVLFPVFAKVKAGVQ